MRALIDPTDLPPERWAEAMRRLAIVRRYASMNGERGSAGPAAIEGAAGLGLSKRSFLRLVQAYRLMREGALQKSRQGRHTEVDPRVDDIVKEVMSDRVVEARKREAVDEIKRRCSADGVEVPSDSTIRRRLKRRRSNGLPMAEFVGDVDFVVDSCATDLDVVGPDGVAWAVLTLLVKVEPIKIVGHLLSAGEPADADLTALLQLIGGDARHEPPLRIGLTGQSATIPERIDLPKDLELVGIGHKKGAVVSRLLGSRLGKLALRPNRHAGIRPDEPVDLPDAQAIVGALMSGGTVT